MPTRGASPIALSIAAAAPSLMPPEKATTRPSSLSRHREAFGRLLALGDRPVLLEVRDPSCRARATVAAVPTPERDEGEQRPDDLTSRRESGAAPTWSVPNIDQSHTATTSGSRHSTAIETERIELRSPSSRNTQAPKAARPQASRMVCSQKERASEYSPTRWRQRNPARASGRAFEARLLSPRRHIRSISEVVIDQWVVTSP